MTSGFLLWKKRAAALRGTIGMRWRLRVRQEDRHVNGLESWLYPSDSGPLEAASWNDGAFPSTRSSLPENVARLGIHGETKAW